MNSTKINRIVWIDCAKGIGIILVVLGHSERGLVSAGIAPESWKLGLDYYLYTFHMPLFVFLAGLNVPNSMKRGRRQFLTQKIATIIWPYFLWSIIFGTTLTLMASYTNGSGSWSDILTIGWRPLGPFWFLYALFVYCMIATILANKPHSLIFLALLLFILGENLPRDSLLQSIFHFFIFYAAGILISPLLASKEISKAWRLFFIIGAVWLGVTTAISTPLNRDYFSVFALPSAVLGGAMIIALANNLKNSLQYFFPNLARHQWQSMLCTYLQQPALAF